MKGQQRILLPMRGIMKAYRSYFLIFPRFARQVCFSAQMPITNIVVNVGRGLFITWNTLLKKEE